jgi:hypothetical protein
MFGYLPVYLRCLATFGKLWPTTCVSSYLCGVCLPVWCLLSTTSAFLYYIFLPVWFLVNFMMFAYLYDGVITVKSARLCPVSSTIWCLQCLPIWGLPSCMISSYPYDVCSTASCLPTCLMFSQLYDIRLPRGVWYTCTVWCLPTFTDDVCISVWCLPSHMIASWLYSVSSNIT